MPNLGPCHVRECSEDGDIEFTRTLPNHEPEKFVFCNFHTTAWVSLQELDPDGVVFPYLSHEAIALILRDITTTEYLNRAFGG